MLRKVHITIQEELVGAPGVIERVASVARLADFNTGRAREFGILSGWVDTDLIHAIEQLPEVEAVELDGLKRATS